MPTAPAATASGTPKPEGSSKRTRKRTNKPKDTSKPDSQGSPASAGPGEGLSSTAPKAPAAMAPKSSVRKRKPKDTASHSGTLATGDNDGEVPKGPKKETKRSPSKKKPIRGSKPAAAAATGTSNSTAQTQSGTAPVG